MLPLERQNAYRARYAAQRPGWRSSGDEVEARLRRCLRPDSRVLDAGCGRGGVMELFWREVALAAGVDADRASLREQRTGMPVACGLAGALPFAGASFDLVLGLWLLEHLERPSEALLEIRRVLRPGGRFLFLTPNVRHPLLWANRLSQRLPALQRRLVPALYGRAEADTFRVHYQANTPVRLRKLAATCGFQVDRLDVIADPSYLAFNDVLFRLSAALEAVLPPDWGVHLFGDWVRAPD